MDDLYLLEWSKTDDCFRIQPIDQALMNNVLTMSKHRDSDYIAVMVATEDECREAESAFDVVLGDNH